MNGTYLGLPAALFPAINKAKLPGESRSLFLIKAISCELARRGIARPDVSNFQCQVCGRRMFTARSTRRTCSAACRCRASYLRKKARNGAANAT